ncbi:MAG TPA: metallopeptidase TldD-related protein, partial [Acidimicrobiales bacterium]|nr:metallopeptidase TldD-related protein [Acidimicrobiales bacterium]
MAQRRFPSPSDVVDQALSTSTSDECVVIVEESSEVDARFANNTTTTNGSRRNRRVVVVSMRAGAGGTSVGVASRSGDPDIAELVRASEADAAGGEPVDGAFALVGPGEAGGTDDPAFATAARSTDLSVISKVFDALGDAFGRAKAAGQVLAGFASHRVETVYLGSSSGLRRRHEQPTGSLELVARSADGSKSAWVAAGTPWFDDVDLGAMHQRLEERLDWAERRVDLPPGRYETILPPDATADLMVSLYEAMSGRDAEDGRNAFSAPGGTTKVGELIASLPFELRSDPAAAGLECSPFLVTGASGTDVSVFDNGLPLGPTAWVDSGRLERLRYHRAGAARSGVPPSAPVDNLVLELPGSSGTLGDLVAGTERGLLLT